MGKRVNMKNAKVVLHGERWLSALVCRATKGLPCGQSMVSEAITWERTGMMKGSRY